MQVLVDTGIFVRALETKHRDHQLSLHAIRHLKEKGHELCVVPQVHYELWVVLTRPVANNGLGMSPKEADEELSRVDAPLFRMYRDERAILFLWRELVRKHGVSGKPAHDARLVAAMVRHQISHLLTFNVADFKRYLGIIALEPNVIARSS